jgi:type 1 fimbriae regulatory protein FimB/type 1 fimbriae regulatory protein FimE
VRWAQRETRAHFSAGHDEHGIYYFGHKNIQHTVRYTEMAPDRFKNFWRD